MTEIFPDLNEFPSEDEEEALKHLQISFVTFDYHFYSKSTIKEEIAFLDLVKHGRASEYLHFENHLESYIFLPEKYKIKTIALRPIINDSTKRDSLLIFRRIYANWILKKEKIPEPEYVAVLRNLIMNKEFIIFSFPEFLWDLFMKEIDMMKQNGGQVDMHDITAKERIYQCPTCGHHVRNIQRYNLKCEICQSPLEFLPQF